jgi:hypothetical protein
MDSREPLTWCSRLSGALVFGFLGGLIGFLTGIALSPFACDLHIWGNLCGLVGFVVFPQVGCALGGISGILFGLRRGFKGEKK